VTWTVKSLDAGIVNATSYGAACFVAQNILRTNILTGEWHSGDISAGGGTPQTDRTDPDFPVSNVYDGKLYVPSKSTNEAVNTYYLYLTIGVGAFFDAIFLRPGIFNGTWTITAERADDANMQTNKTTLASWAGLAGEQRVLKLSLGAGNQYFEATSSGSNVIRFTFAGSNSTPPEVNEIVIGQRRILNRKLSTPYDPTRLGAEGSRFTASGRAQTKYYTASGFSDQSARYNPTDGGIFGLDDTTSLKNVYKESGNGQYPILYIRDPDTADAGSAPHDVLFGFIPDEDNMPLDSNLIRDFDFEFMEDPPFLSAE